MKSSTLSGLNIEIFKLVNFIALRRNILSKIHFIMKRKNNLTDLPAKGSKALPKRKRSKPNAIADVKDAINKTEKIESDNNIVPLLKSTLLSILNSRKPGATC